MNTEITKQTIENEELKTQIGDSTDYKQVKAIPWLKEYFDLDMEAVYSQLGKVLTTVS